MKNLEYWEIVFKTKIDPIGLPERSNNVVLPLYEK